MFHFWPFFIFWPFHGLLTLLLIVLVLVLVFRHRPYAVHAPAPVASPAARSEALAILEARYARGEIQREEYLQKKQDLGGPQPAPG